MKQLTNIEILDYEIRSSWWACHVSWEWAKNLAGRYFAWKVNRKYDRYATSVRKQLEYSSK